MTKVLMTKVLMTKEAELGKNVIYFLSEETFSKTEFDLEFTKSFSPYRNWHLRSIFCTGDGAAGGGGKLNAHTADCAAVCNRCSTA